MFDKINVVLFLSQDKFRKYFEESEKVGLSKFLPDFITSKLQCVLRFLYNVWVVFWLQWNKNKNPNNIYTIACCDKRKDADVITQWFKLQNIVLAEDIGIKDSTVSNLNRTYKRDLVVIQSNSPSAANMFLKVNIPDNSNIFLTMGEYESITDFELAVEAFHILYSRLIQEGFLKKLTFLVILGDEMEINKEQQKYFKKLEGFAFKNGLQDNVYFLKISPQVSKEMLMKIALAIIFTNPAGCYDKNLQEAVSSGKHLLLPDTRWYALKLASLGCSSDSGFLLEPDPHVFARHMYRHIRNRFLLRIVSRATGLQIKK